jgi:hypothetical protein
MAAVLPSVQAEWMTIINAVWPEIVLPGGSSQSNFFTSVQLLKRNILDRMQTSDPALPYAFLAIGAFPSLKFTQDRNDKNNPVTVFYVDSEANGASQITIDAKLCALDQYVRSRVNSTFCVLEDAAIDSTDLNPVNAILSVKSQVKVYGGTITYSKVYTTNLT